MTITYRGLQQHSRRIEGILLFSIYASPLQQRGPTAQALWITHLSCLGNDGQDWAESNYKDLACFLGGWVLLQLVHHQVSRSSGSSAPKPNTTTIFKEALVARHTSRPHTPHEKACPTVCCTTVCKITTDESGDPRYMLQPSLSDPLLASQPSSPHHSSTARSSVARPCHFASQQPRPWRHTLVTQVPISVESEGSFNFLTCASCCALLWITDEHSIDVSKLKPQPWCYILCRF